MYGIPPAIVVLYTLLYFLFHFLKYLFGFLFLVPLRMLYRLVSSSRPAALPAPEDDPSARSLGARLDDLVLRFDAMRLL